MLKRHDDLDRRRFMTLCASTVATTLAVSESDAAELPHVVPTDPAARALGYVEDTRMADAMKFPQHKPTQACDNCKQFTEQQGSEYGLCVIFPGKGVHETGWCGAYQAKT
jgi:High potential iron-sulfur protein